MKILSLTPIKTNIDYQNKQNPFTSKQMYSHDIVQFRAKKPSENMVNSMLEGISGELGLRVKNLMSNPEKRNVFITTLVSMAATVTELMFQITDKTEAPEQTNIGTAKTSPEVPEGKTQDNPQEVPSKEQSTEKRLNITDVKTKKAKLSDVMGEEALIKKLQEMADRGLSQAQMGEELGGVSQATAGKYLKLYKIKPNAKIAKVPQAISQEEILQKKYVDFLNENVDIAENLELKKYAPNLISKYENCLRKYVNNPKKSNVYEIIDGYNNIFNEVKNIPSRFKKKNMELFEKYSESSFENIGILFSHIEKDMLPQRISEIGTENYSAEFISNWAKYPNLDTDELEQIKSLSDETKADINTVKKGNKFSFNIIKDNEYNNYKFVLNFTKDIPLPEKLKTISKFHEALYDPIYLHKDNFAHKTRRVDIQENLYYLLKKDKSLDSLYSIMKYLTPYEFEDLNFTSKELMNLKTNDPKYSLLKSRLESTITELDIKSNPRLKMLEDVINDKKLFKDIIGNDHAKLRFISRFVLRDNSEEITNLHDECELAMDYLEEDLNQKINSKCIILPFKMQDSTAPIFYLTKSRLGDYIRITLNRDGQIHTIFEDSKLKSKALS